MNSNNLHSGQTTNLPDGPSGRIINIEDGIEYGVPVRYITVVNSLGQEVTRWVTK